MSISGLSLVLSKEEGLRSQAIAALTAVKGLSLGPSVEHRIAAVLETEGPRTDVGRLREIQALEGVAHVDVVAVFYPEQTPLSAEMTTEEGRHE